MAKQTMKINLHSSRIFWSFAFWRLEKFVTSPWEFSLGSHAGRCVFSEILEITRNLCLHFKVLKYMEIFFICGYNKFWVLGSVSICGYDVLVLCSWIERNFKRIQKRQAQIKLLRQMLLQELRWQRASFVWKNTIIEALSCWELFFFSYF